VHRFHRSDAAGTEQRWAALQRAWMPLQAGWKAAWWHAVALPEDVDDEAAFRQGKGFHVCYICWKPSLESTKTQTIPLEHLAKAGILYFHPLNTQ